MGYEDVKKWRRRNPEKMRKYMRDYYAKTSCASRSHVRWDEDEKEKVWKHDKPDSELAREIDRSVKAIQLMRSRIKKSYP